MAQILVTQPPFEPVTVEDVKNHTVIEEVEDEALLGIYIKSAREYCESITGRRFVQQTWNYKFNNFPVREYFDLPQYPVQSISSITYMDLNSSPLQQTLSTNVYDLDNGVSPAKVFLKYNQVWPNCRGHRNDIVVTYIAGYALSSSLDSPITQAQYTENIPERVKHAIMMLAAEAYKNRETTLDMASFHNKLIDNLLQPIRLFRV